MGFLRRMLPTLTRRSTSGGRWGTLARSGELTGHSLARGSRILIPFTISSGIPRLRRRRGLCYDDAGDASRRKKTAALGGRNWPDAAKIGPRDRRADGWR